MEEMDFDFIIHTCYKLICRMLPRKIMMLGSGKIVPENLI